MKNTLLTLAIALLGASILTANATAMKAVKLLNHQGRLLDNAGQPVTGAHVLTFRIYTDPTGGTLLHEESKTIVFGSDGLFNVQIGSDVPLDIEDLVDPNETAPEALRYLEVEVDSDGPMPRVQLVSSPYALGAFRVAGDFFSSHNEILMIDSTGDTTATLASKKLYVGNLSWGVDVDSTGKTEMTMHSESGTSQTSKVDKSTPALLEAICNATNSTDTAASALSLSTTAGGKFDLTNHNSSDDHGFIADATPTHAKVEVKSDPGVGILKGGFMEADVDGSRVGLSTESTTDAHGEFWFTDLIPGEYTVREHMSVRSTSIDSAYMDMEIDSNEVRFAMGSESTTDVHGEFWFTGLKPGSYSVTEHMSVRSTGTDSAYKHLDIDSAAVRLAMGSESTTDEHGYFWFTHLDPGLTGGVTQTMIARTAPTDSTWGQIKIDSSEAGLRMNKSDLIAHVASKAGSAHMSLTDISAADKGEIRAQHNQTDLEFVMRLHNSADTAQLKMQAGVAGPEMQLSTEAGGSTQNRAKLTHDSFELTEAQLSVLEPVFDIDANGTATGASMRLRYPNVTGGATQVFVGDLNGDAVPDLSVDGNVGIGSSAPTEKLHVDGNICVTGGYLTCSDARYKTDIEPIENAVAQLQKLQGVKFDWRREDFAERDFPDARQVGFVAQDVQQVLPGVVSEGADGYLAMDYARLTPLLVEALKTQQERIDKLEALLLQLTENQVTR